LGSVLVGVAGESSPTHWLTVTAGVVVVLVVLDVVPFVEVEVVVVVVVVGPVGPVGPDAPVVTFAAVATAAPVLLSTTAARSTPAGTINTASATRQLRGKWSRTLQTSDV
jgi:hypothetical protein